MSTEPFCPHASDGIPEIHRAEFGKPVIGHCPICKAEKPIAVTLLLTDAAESKNNGPWCVDVAGNWKRPEAPGAVSVVVERRPEAPTVANLIAAYYAKPENGAGGNCHVVLDDNNLGDDSVRFCLEECEREGDEDGATIMRLLARMKRTGRARAIVLAKEASR